MKASLRVLQVSAVLLVATSAHAKLARGRYRSMRPVETHGTSGLVGAGVPPGLFSGAREDLADVRVVDDRDSEVPYVLRTEVARDETTLVDATVEDHVLVPDGVQFKVDLGPAGPQGRHHSRIRLSTTSKNFRRRVLLEGSEDATSWVTLRQLAYVFDFSVEPGRHAELLEVDYPLSTLRYLRATLYSDGEPPLAVTRVAVLRAERHEDAFHTAFSGRPEAKRDPAGRATWFEIDLGQSGVPQSEIEIVTSAEDFYRAVYVESRAADARASWQYAGGDVAYRIHVEGRVDQRVRMRFPETRARTLRLTIQDGDDPPLPIERVVVRGNRRDLLFRAAADRRYRVLYGLADARPPAYELEQVLARQGRITPAAASIGARVRNPDYDPGLGPPRPWTDRNPALLYGLLGLAVVVLGALTMRLLKKAGAEPGASPGPGTPAA